MTAAKLWNDRKLRAVFSYRVSVPFLVKLPCRACRLHNDNASNCPVVEVPCQCLSHRRFQRAGGGASPTPLRFCSAVFNVLQSLSNPSNCRGFSLCGVSCSEVVGDVLSASIVLLNLQWLSSGPATKESCFCDRCRSSRCSTGEI